MPVFRSIVVRSLCCIVLPLAASGQSRKFAVDLGVEGWSGWADGRSFSNKYGPAVQGIASWRVRPFSHGAVVVGGGVGAQGVISFERCVIAPVSTGCAPDYPAFSSLVGLIGLEGKWGVTARVLVGPGAFHSSDTVLGFQGRADIATPALGRVALLLSACRVVLPSFGDHRYGMKAAGIGLRIQ